MKKSDIKKLKPEKWARDWRNDPKPADVTADRPEFICTVCKKLTWKFHSHGGGNKVSEAKVRGNSQRDANYE